MLLDNTMPMISGLTVAKIWRQIEDEGNKIHFCQIFFSHFLSQAGVAVKARIWLVTASNAIQSDDLDGILHKPVGINAITEILYK